MKRLAQVGLTLCLLVTACHEGNETAGQTGPARVVAAPASQPADQAKTWCDVYFEPTAAPTFAFPPVEPARPGTSAFPGAGNGWRWVNIWATWCAPCLREMPLIELWVQSLRRLNLPVELWYLSVDEDKEVLAEFFTRKPQIAAKNSLRATTSKEQLESWLTRWRLEADTAIPLNMIVDPQGRLRCVRKGSVAESDFAVVRAFMRGASK